MFWACLIGYYLTGVVALLIEDNPSWVSFIVDRWYSYNTLFSFVCNFAGEMLIMIVLWLHLYPWLVTVNGCPLKKSKMIQMEFFSKGLLYFLCFVSLTLLVWSKFFWIK